MAETSFQQTAFQNDAFQIVLLSDCVFQGDAFQNDAFQVCIGPPPTGGGRRFHWLEAGLDAPIVAEALWENLHEEYGPDRGRQTYFAMEREAKGPFAPGNKYDASKRPPQPVVMVKSKSPPPHSAKPAPPPPSDRELLARTREAVQKMGFGRKPE